MKLKVIIHEAEEGGYWAEVPAILGCATQGDTFEELISNLYEAVEACLSIDLVEVVISGKDKVLELATTNLRRGNSGMDAGIQSQGWFVPIKRLGMI